MAAGGRKNADEALALALAAGQSVKAAASVAGVAERTVARRLADPEFRRRVSDLRSEMVAQALGKMADGMGEAAGTLRDLLAAGSESVRLGAARALLELGSKLRESVELEARIAALEADRHEAESTRGPAGKERQAAR